jgi:hypothetical protein
MIFYFVLPSVLPYNIFGLFYLVMYLHQLGSGGNKFTRAKFFNECQPKNTKHTERVHMKRDADEGEKRVKR